VRSGPYVWQYCKHPPAAKPPASKSAEQAHAAAPSQQPVATVAASDDTAAPGVPSLPESLYWLPGPVPRDAASGALLNEWPEDAEHKTYAPYSVLKGLEPILTLAPTQRARASPAAVAAAGQVAQKADQGRVQALRAMHVRATVQCHECNKLRAVYCKQALRSLEKLHAGRRAVVPDDTGSDSDAADGNGSDGMGRGSAVADETLSQRGARRCSQRALTAGIVQDAIDSSLKASESDVTQDDADLDAHADSGSDAIAETDASADEVQLQVHANAGADADARAALSRGHAGKRMRPCVAKRGWPSGQAGRASAHGPGTYVYDCYTSSKGQYLAYK
jgi:hypothetical protein